MYRKKEKEFQYAPVIVKILEDVVGGGTVARAGLKGLIDELPPGVIVGKDSNGLYHPLKTAEVSGTAGESATEYEVDKGHLFKVGDFVTLGGGLLKAASAITAIDKSDGDSDTITVEATLTAAVKGDVLVQVVAAAAAGSAKFAHEPVAVTMNKVNVTVANQQSGLLVRGSVNESVMPYPVDAALKATLPLIRFV